LKPPFPEAVAMMARMLFDERSRAESFGAVAELYDLKLENEQ
jgi:hypothetical protein